MNKAHSSWAGAMVCGGVVLGLAVLLAAASAQAQPAGGGRQQMSPDDAKAVWRIQGISVAMSLDIPRETGRKVVEAYTTSRESLNAGVEELRSQAGGQGGGRAGFERYRELMEKERGKLAVALKDILGEEKADKAVKQLGTFSRAWDRYVNTLRGMDLERETMRAAMKEVNKHNMGYAKAREEATDGDWQGMRETMEKLKADLDTALANVLTADQLAKWKEETAPRQRGQGPRQG